MASLLDLGNDNVDVGPIQQTLVQIRECFVYRVAATHSARGYAAGDWGLDKPMATCSCVVKALGEEAAIQLFKQHDADDDSGARKMLAQSIIVLSKDPAEKSSRVEYFCEPCTDTSRYFVIKVQDPRNPSRVASLGIGFRLKEDAYSFTAALQDHAKYVKNQRETEAFKATGGLSGAAAAPSVDLSLKEGQTMKVKINLKKKKKKKKKKKDKDGGKGAADGGGGDLTAGLDGLSLGGSGNGGGNDDDDEFGDDDFGDFVQ